MPPNCIKPSPEPLVRKTRWKGWLRVRVLLTEAIQVRPSSSLRTLTDSTAQSENAPEPS